MVLSLKPHWMVEVFALFPLEAEDGRIEVNSGQNCRPGTGWWDWCEHILTGKTMGTYSGKSEWLQLESVQGYCLY